MNKVIVTKYLLSDNSVRYKYRFLDSVTNKYISKSGFTSRASALKEGKDDQISLLSKIDDDNDILYKDLLNEWIENECVGFIKQSTVTGYRKRISKVLFLLP